MQPTCSLLELEPIILISSLSMLKLHESEKFEEFALHVLIIECLYVNLCSFIDAGENLV